MASCSSQGRGSGKRHKKVRRRRRGQRPPGQDYYIQDTHKDMLLLIPSEMEESVIVVKRVRRTEDDNHIITTDSGWGSVMPPEILHRVFLMVVGSEGAVPAMCRLAQVCRLWLQVASTPDLWQRVSVSQCWTLPGKKDPPKLQNKVKNTIEALIQHRLSQVSDFSLHHWSDHITLVLQSLASSCPLLTSLTLSHCSKVTADALLSVGERCPLLTSLNLQNSQVDSNALFRFLGLCGSGLQRLYLSFSAQTNSIMNLLASGCCPELRVLEVNRGIQDRTKEVHVCAEELQASCPKLEVLRLLNVIFSLKSKSSLSLESPGFCRLQELCLATSTFSLINDGFCKRLLRDCTQLKVLDLRGCYKVTPEVISDLPCTDLERLYLGMYCSTMKLALPSSGCSLLTRRWRHSLQELDLSGQNFSEAELSRTLGILCEGGANETLQSLSLVGTKVTAAAIRDILSAGRALTHLDLTSCRNIPRGLKCVYRGREEIQRCLEKLSTKMEEESSE
ncbi:F-box/LRR-repeat protein 6 isoform 1-T2 [Leptodactylus fuscus]|uniref:F-box/LRR-repeat protein 6 n=1 Tax=Leptodactylus fuscus TaxID=238119 RepID=UPI003F4E8649